VHARVDNVSVRVEIGLNDSGPDTGAADVDRQDPAIFAENLLGRQVHTA
jgi:hypothetical protein